MKREWERNPAEYIATERVAPLLQEWIDRHKKEHPVASGANDGILEAFSEATGVSARSIFRFLHHNDTYTARGGRTALNSQYMKLETVDLLFVGMDCVHLFYMPPELGGFSDVYFHENVVGPDFVQPFPFEVETDGDRMLVAA